MLICNTNRHAGKIPPTQHMTHASILNSMVCMNMYHFYTRFLSSTQLRSILLMDVGNTDPVTNLQSYNTWIKDWMATYQEFLRIFWYHPKPKHHHPISHYTVGKLKSLKVPYKYIFITMNLQKTLRLFETQNLFML